jgi:hypothetical protein
MRGAPPRSGYSNVSNTLGAVRVINVRVINVRVIKTEGACSMFRRWSQP